MTTAKDVLLIKDNDVKFADFRFTDPRGKAACHLRHFVDRGRNLLRRADVLRSISVRKASFSSSTTLDLRPDPYNTGFKLDMVELPISGGTDYEGGNLGHRIGFKKGYFAVPPQDLVQDMRSEMLSAMAKMGVKVEKHHHEVASAQHELGMKFAPLTVIGRSVDDLQVLHPHGRLNVYGKTATFMPKPVYGDNGSGMHCHQSIWKEGKPVFAGNKYADLSETALSYIAGVIKHAKAINAFSNPTTNSYSGLCRDSNRRCCSPTRRATAPPRAVFPTRPIRRPSASRCASPIRSPIPTSASPRC